MSEIAAWNAVRRVPAPINEPVKSYAPGSPERAELKARLASMANERVEIATVGDGQRANRRMVFVEKARRNQTAACGQTLAGQRRQQTAR